MLHISDTENMFPQQLPCHISVSLSYIILMISLHLTSIQDENSLKCNKNVLYYTFNEIQEQM